MSSLTLKKWELRTWYLGQILEIELWAWDDGWLVSNTIDDCLQRQIAKKIFKLKIKAYWSLSALVTTWLCHAALKYCISFATDWAAKLCKLWLRTWNWFRIMMPDIVSKLLHASISSCCALWFKSEQTDSVRHPFIGQVADFDLLLCTGFDSEHADQIHAGFDLRTFLLRDQGMIGRWSKARGAALAGNNFLSIPLKISFGMKRKSDLFQHKIYKA